MESQTIRAYANSLEPTQLSLRKPAQYFARLSAVSNNHDRYRIDNADDYMPSPSAGMVNSKMAPHGSFDLTRK